MQRLPQGGRALGAHVLGGDQLGEVAQPQVAAGGGELRARERGGGGHPLLHTRFHARRLGGLGWG